VHPGGLAHPLSHQIVEGDAAGSLGDQRQYHIARVVVLEPFTGFDPWGCPSRTASNAPWWPARARAPEGVVVDRVVGALVQVIPDAGTVGQQVLDRHPKCHASAGATVKHQPESVSWIKRSSVKDQVKPERQASPGARHFSVPPARTGRKGRKPASAFVQVEASYGLRG
jgi:hypothetical protein